MTYAFAGVGGIVVVAIIIHFILVISAAVIASQKGHSGFSWFFICLFTGIIGFILMAGLNDQRLSDKTDMIMQELEELKETNRSYLNYIKQSQRTQEQNDQTDDKDYWFNLQTMDPIEELQ